MNRGGRAPIPDAWRRSIALYHKRMRIRALGRASEADRMRIVDQIRACESAPMSPFADMSPIDDRFGRREQEHLRRILGR